MNPSIRQVQIFNEVARLTSVAAAAKVLHLTAPAVSLQIKALEETIGQPLFDRKDRRMTLTSAGRHYLSHAQHILSAMADGNAAMTRFARGEGGLLTIAMVSAAKYFLPRLLAIFHRRHPGIEIRIQIGSREQLKTQLTDREVDLCVMGRPPDVKPVVAKSFAPHPHVMIMPPTHRLANQQSVAAIELNREAFIVREVGSGTRLVMDEFFDQHNLQPKVVVEIASNEGIKQAVMANMGISLVSTHIIAFEWASGLIAAPSVESLPIVRNWHIVYRSSHELPPVAELFCDFILEHGADFLEHLGTFYFQPNISAADGEMRWPAATASSLL